MTRPSGVNSANAGGVDSALQPDDQQYNTQLNAKDALYISAIQELSKEVETLKAEVKALKEA